MKKMTLFVLLLLTVNTFAQKLSDKIKLFENDINHWDKAKSKKWTLKDRMAFYDINAVSIAVIKDYKVEWIKAYGYADVSEKKLATPQTLFQAASISKSINSLGILKLVQEGKLNLDSDINNYLTNWKFPYDSVSKGKKISIVNLLSHTAGLSVGGYNGYEKGKDLPTIIEMLDGLKPANSNAVRSVFEPGSKFQYSGGGVLITQQIVENVTGEKYNDYMKNNILSPLGMNNSFFNTALKKDEIRLATGYSSNIKEVRGKYHIYPEMAAAGLWTNPTELAKYVIETQLSLLGKSNRILSTEISKKRVENKLGVFLNDFSGSRYFGHSGGNEGFGCFYVASLEDGNGMVIMMNGRNSKFVDEMVSSISSLNDWKNYPAVTQKESISSTIKKECYKDIDKGIELYKKLKNNHGTDYNFSSESELNMLGYDLLRDGNIESAIKILTLNVTEFPNSANAYDSRGEAYFNKKEYLLSKKDYSKVLALDPTNQNAKEMLLKIDKEIGN